MTNRRWHEDDHLSVDPLAALALIATSTPPARAASVAPDLRFRTIEGRRVNVSYHQGLEAMAREAVVLADAFLEEHVARYGNQVKDRVTPNEQTDDPMGAAKQWLASQCN